jgi:hypothetical protein
VASGNQLASRFVGLPVRWGKKSRGRRASRRFAFGGKKKEKGNERQAVGQDQQPVQLAVLDRLIPVAADLCERLGTVAAGYVV